jgi:uncharacterized protein YjiS (DUF1127 family)
MAPTLAGRHELATMSPHYLKDIGYPPSRSARD